MSAPTETDKTTASSGPESPTTARPLEMDDDDVQETGVLGGEDSAKTTPPATTNTSTNPTSGEGAGAPAPAATVPAEEAAPPQPPRPQTEVQKNVAILKEAFPSVDEGVIRAVLSASRGRIDPAFNALLEMTDPDAVKNEPQEEAPPPQPPRPARAQMSQLEADELYARQLAEDWDNAGAYEARTSNRGPGAGARSRQQGGQHDHQDREPNFFEDDLPIIQERLKQGFQETQTKVNSWITTIKKRIDEEFENDDDQDNRRRPTQGQEQFPGPRPGQASRRSGDYERYDADPQVLSDDFAGMRFTSDGTPVRDARNSSNPDLSRATPPSKSPRPSGERRVAFKDGSEQIDVYGASPRLSADDSASKTKSSKWQPLSNVDPSPINDDNDPFSLGDSEDERDAKDKTHTKSGSKDIKMDDNERLKAAAAEAMADSLVESKKDGVPSGETAKKD